MKHRPELEEKVGAYTLGYRAGLEEGRKQGIAIQQTRYRRIEWFKLFLLILAALFTFALIGNAFNLFT